jgi:hypothetical protein
MAQTYKRLSPAAWLGLAVACPLVLAVGLMFVPRSAITAYGSAGFYAAMLLVTGAAIYFARNHWCALDETGRVAHRTAWYWGGSTGLGVAIVLVAVTLKAPPLLSWLEGTVTSLIHGKTSSIGLAFFFGAMFAAILQIIGYILAWLAWWGARRNAG